MPDNIPLLDLRRQTAFIRPQLEAAMGRVLDHGRFILGPEVEELEDRIAVYCGTKFAISCASGSDAILLPLMALGAGPGHKVITTPYTFFATAGSIARLGATPVFVDIDPGTFNLDPAQLSRYLDGCSAPEIASIKAILPVHLFGQCAEMAAINAIAARYRIPVIEDAAQALGAKFDGRRAGALGWCAAFSTFPSKNLGGFGDGGFVTTDDGALADRLRMLRNHGSASTYYHPVVGINSRLDTLQAAILLVKLDYLDVWTAQRRANAATYRTQIERTQIERKLAGLVIPPLDSGLEHAGRLHVYNQFTIRVPDRDKVRHALAELGVASAIYYPVPLHLQECFRQLGYREGDLPRSEAAARETLSLPIEPGLNHDDIACIVDRLAQALKTDL
jgi:dTDP-4-amino-4,6-dideoxygalactose transaminase